LRWLVRLPDAPATRADKSHGLDAVGAAGYREQLVSARKLGEQRRNEARLQERHITGCGGEQIPLGREAREFARGME
jgi:hypothetical protein